MRDVSAFAALPSRAQLAASIPDRERFRPEPRLLRRVEVRPREDGYSDLLLGDGSPPRRIHPMVAEATRALLEGARFDAIVERAAPLWEGRTAKMADRVLRTYMLELQAQGIVEIPFEEPPAVLNDRYERVKLLGRGGMGIVYLCRDRARDGALVVVKHAWGWTVRIEKAERVSRREAAALALTDHPLIPRLVETFEVRGLMHIARDYADGRPLLGIVREIRDASGARRLGIARDMCDAIHHIHDRGMLYMDVKLDNFVLSPTDGRARLLDLGLCRPHHDAPVKLRIPIGSRGYVAPEVIAERVATPRSDIYGLGRALYLMISGEKPRQKWSAQELAARLRAQGADEREIRLVAWLAADRPEDRPASLEAPLREIDALRRELEHAAPA